MKHVFFLSILSTLLFPTLLGVIPEKKAVETGKLLINFRNIHVGEEYYTLYVRSDGKMEFSAENNFYLPKGAGNIGFHFKVNEVVDKDLNPISYDDTYWVNNAQSYLHVIFDKGLASDNAIMGGRALTRTAKVHTNFTILEEGVYSLYYLLYKKFILGNGEKQVIYIYIPKIAAELKANCTYNGETSVKSSLGRQMKLKRYFVDVGGFQGVSMSINDKGQLINLQIPRMEINITRDLSYDVQNKAIQNKSK